MINEHDIQVLQERAAKLEVLAHKRGLRPFKTEFHVAPSEIIYEFGAYGMPGRFSHWSHGRDYFRMKTSYDTGQSKIYELVVNTDPALAFLLSNNDITQNTFVIAHVYGHTDFFANNQHFAYTNRDMVSIMERHSLRLHEYAERYGSSRVEGLLDAALALAPHVDDRVQDQIDSSQLAWKRKKEDLLDWRDAAHQHGWSDLFFEKKQVDWQALTSMPLKAPVRGDDLLYIISEYSSGLEDWERDVLNIVRQEELYFKPQGRTKIFNEGWAVFWHLRLLRDLDDITQQEGFEIAKIHAGVACPHPGSLNPYYLGWKVLEAINKNHGGDENSCEPYLFTLREREDDVSLLRNELTEEMVKELDLFLFNEKDQGSYEPYVDQVCTTKEWEKVRDVLVNTLSGRGQPRISVVSVNYDERSQELCLYHHDDGLPLDIGHAEKTLEYVERLWKGPVRLVTNNAPGYGTSPVNLLYSQPQKHRRLIEALHE